MKCLKHQNVDAVAVCAYCGRALCLDCIPKARAERMICSDACADQLAQQARALASLESRSRQSAKASAFYCYLTAALSAGASIAAWFMMPAPFLIYFTAACAVALCLAGFWYGRGTRQ